MKRSEFSEVKHCCKYMGDFLEDFRIPIDYEPDENRYFIPLMWPHAGTQGLFFCPWCGTKLPPVVEKDLD